MRRLAWQLILIALWVLSSQKTLLATPIRILVVYTPAAQTASEGTIGSIAASSVDRLNSICDSSGITGEQCELAGQVVEVDYTENQDQNTNVTRLTNPSDGYMDEVHFLRYQRNAQIVVLLLATNTSVHGNVGPNNQNANIEHAFAVVQWDYADRDGWWVFAHEVGHLMGGQHENGNSDSGAWNGRGAVLPRENGNILTMMCNNGAEAPKILRWSGYYYDSVYGWMYDSNNSNHDRTQMKVVWSNKQPTVSNWVVPRPTNCVIDVPVNYSTIEEALTNSLSGDIVQVHPDSYALTSDVTVPDGVTLRISPGTNVASNGYYKLRIEGRLEANGATFTRSGGQWKGIEFYNGESDGTLYGCTIENALYGIFAYNTEIPISHCTIQNNSTGVYASSYWTGMAWNLIKDNSPYGVYCANYGDPNLTPSNILRFNGWAVRGDATSQPYLGSYIGYNSLYWNDYYDVYSDYGGTISACGNWWGDYPPYPSVTAYVDYSGALDSDPNGWAKIAAKLSSPAKNASPPEPMSNAGHVRHQ